MQPSINQIIDIGLQYIAANPGQAMLSFFTLPAVRTLLISRLTPAQLEWLSRDIQLRPTGLLDFLRSAEGAAEIERLFAKYHESVCPSAPQESAEVKAALSYASPTQPYALKLAAPKNPAAEPRLH